MHASLVERPRDNALANLQIWLRTVIGRGKSRFAVWRASAWRYRKRIGGHVNFIAQPLHDLEVRFRVALDGPGRRPMGVRVFPGTVHRCALLLPAFSLSVAHSVARTSTRSLVARPSHLCAPPRRTFRSPPPRPIPHPSLLLIQTTSTCQRTRGRWSPTQSLRLGVARSTLSRPTCSVLCARPTT